jgi:CspA family cold shock protein
MSSFTGTVKWYNAEKAYGFLASDEGGPDLFMHVSQLPEGFAPTPGMRVLHEIGLDRRGREMALNVRLL